MRPVRASSGRARSGARATVRVLALLAAVLLAAAAVLLALVVQPLVAPIESQPPAVNAAALAEHVRHLSVDLHPRSADQPEKLERAMAYVEAQLRRAGATDVQSQPVKVDEATYRNVIARFGPREGALVVIGAHVDSHGHAAAGARDPRGYTADSHTPGADDNASGVAGLIELARLFAATPPPRPIELVAYTLEEPPHFRGPNMGSAVHARSLQAGGREPVLMVSLEMIGTFIDAPHSQRYPLPGMQWLYGDRGDFVAIVNRFGDFGVTRRAKALMSGATRLPVRSINAPPLVPGIDFSDHLNYWRLGMPAIMLTDTAFMRNVHYHSAHDTHEKLDVARMAQVVQAAHALAVSF